MTNYSSEAGEPNVAQKWREAPYRMTAPHRSKPPTFKPNHFPINRNPEVLDSVYVRVLGEGGDRALTEEVKWLAVTHKSFDHGRRGYNDRLAFLGTMSSVFMPKSALTHVDEQANGLWTYKHQ